MSVKVDRAGGFAFPSVVEGWESNKGMTIRDYFAGRALVGLLVDHGVDTGLPASVAGLAADAYHIADAMLAERRKSTGGDE